MRAVNTRLQLLPRREQLTILCTMYAQGARKSGRRRSSDPRSNLGTNSADWSKDGLPLHKARHNLGRAPRDHTPHKSWGRSDMCVQGSSGRRAVARQLRNASCTLLLTLASVVWRSRGSRQRREWEIRISPDEGRAGYPLKLFAW
jgi:hypothetical protein